MRLIGLPFGAAGRAGMQTGARAAEATTARQVADGSERGIQRAAWPDLGAACGAMWPCQVRAAEAKSTVKRGEMKAGTKGEVGMRSIPAKLARCRSGRWRSFPIAECAFLVFPSPTKRLCRRYFA